MENVDIYLARVPEPERKALEHIRRCVHHTLPEAKDVISYSMPGFTYKGKYLAGYNAFKDHLSFFPTSEPIEVLRSKLEAYKLSRGTIQFTLDAPLPEALIEELILIRKKAIDASAKPAKQDSGLAEDISEALTAAGKLEAFTGLAPSHKNEYLTWIESAKKESTRQARIAKMLTMLH